MGYTTWLKKNIRLTAAAVLSACMLFGCTRADVASSSGGTADNSQSAAQNTQSNTGKSSESGNTLAGGGAEDKQTSAGKAAQTASGTTVGTAAGTTAPTVAGTTTTAAGTAKGSQTASSGSSTASTSSSGSSTASTPSSGSSTASTPSVQKQTKTPTAQNVSGTTTHNTPSGTTPPQSAETAHSVIPAQDAGTDVSQEGDGGEDISAGGSVAGSMSGEYEKNDGTESVTVSIASDHQISFQFSVSGIGAVAQASGNTAVYYGDDGFSITFEGGGDSLSVTVNGEGGSESPVNGVYYRVLDDGSDAGSASDDDGQDEDMDFADVQ